MTLGVAAGGGTYLWPKDCGRRPDHIVRPDNIGVMAYASRRPPRCETRSPFPVCRLDFASMGSEPLYEE